MPIPDDYAKKVKMGFKKLSTKKNDKSFSEINWDEKPPQHFKNTVHYILDAKEKLMENIFPKDTRGN
jgi:hypothetical protein